MNMIKRCFNAFSKVMLLATNGDILLSDPQAGSVFVLRDSNKVGTADQVFTFAIGLNQPFGMAFYNDYLYVANTDAIVRFDYTPGQTASSGPPTVIVPNLTAARKKTIISYNY